MITFTLLGKIGVDFCGCWRLLFAYSRFFWLLQHAAAAEPMAPTMYPIGHTSILPL
jgi:hypothetical protein